MTSSLTGPCIPGPQNWFAYLPGVNCGNTPARRGSGLGSLQQQHLASDGHWVTVLQAHSRDAKA